jgi:DNA-binding transcriptional ArsR family regulator
MNETPISMTALASALGNPVRWRALQELAAGEPLLTIELSERVGMPQNPFSRHMKVLLAAGLVTQNRAGQYAIPAVRLVSKEERVVDFGTCLLRLGGGRSVGSV